MKTSIILILVLLFAGCTVRPLVPSEDFGAYYTKINSSEEFERFSRTGDYADIVVDLGKENGRLVFWRGSSYLPYWETAAGKRIFVDEIIPRKGDGEGRMPDKVNTYSRVFIIENNDKQVVVHWRYLPEFEGGNPHSGVSATDFVEENFTISPNGKVFRTIKKGTVKIDDWNDPLNVAIQEFTLTDSGISGKSFQKAKKTKSVEVVTGNAVVAQPVVKPVAWFKFDEGTGDETTESFSQAKSEITGDKTLWKKGVSGTALQFDGYKTTVKIPGNKAPQLSDELTLEGWVAIAAYPWSWCPIVQQADDVPETVRLYRGDLDVTDIELKDGELSAHVDGGDDMEDAVTGAREDDEDEHDLDDVEFMVKYQKEDDTGYFLGIDAHGHPGFKLRVGGIWEELTSDVHLERKTWYHIAATYSKDTGKMSLFVDGKPAGEKRVAKANIELSSKNIQVGRGKPRRQTEPVRENTFAGTFSFDGMFDEIKIYDVALSEAQLSETFAAYDKTIKPDMDDRVLPKGENRDRFGAYYTNMKFYDTWDNLWRFGEYPDVVVEFENNPSKFVFWRGVSYIPMIVNEKEQWYSNEFNETWSTSGGKGCQEPMSDKQCYYNHARILENTPARAVVHYRFPLVDVLKIKANYVEETGWYDVADWYYYIYPDGAAVKTCHLWTSGERIHEWQESMAIFGPDQHPHDMIERHNTVTMLRLDGKYKRYSWTHAPPDGVDKPERSNIQHINYTGEYDPVTIAEIFLWNNVYGGEVTDYAVFPTWNHWPVAQMPSDGRYASYPDRTCHSSLTHVGPPIYREASGDRPFYSKIFMEGMLNHKPKDLIPLAKSWLKAPALKEMKGCSGDYDKGQRAYVLNTETSELSFSIACSKKQPMVNACFVVKGWGQKTTGTVKVDGNTDMVKQGVFKDTDGSNTLVVWVEKESTSPVQIEIMK